jgi:hypothetical protein
MSFRYNSAKEAEYAGTLNWISDTFRAVLINLSLYTPSAAHQNLSDIPAGARAALSGVLTGKTNVAGAYNCDPFQFTAVAAGPACGAIAIYKDTGVASTSALLLYIDTATGLPVTPNGTDIVCTPDSSANKLFKT